MPGEDPGLPGFWAPQLLQRPETGEKGTPRGPRPAVFFWFMAGLWDGSGEVRGKGVGAWWGRFAVNIYTAHWPELQDFTKLDRLQAAGEGR